LVGYTFVIELFYIRWYNIGYEVVTVNKIYWKNIWNRRIWTIICTINKQDKRIKDVYTIKRTVIRKLSTTN